MPKPILLPFGVYPRVITALAKKNYAQNVSCEQIARQRSLFYGVSIKTLGTSLTSIRMLYVESLEIWVAAPRPNTLY